MNRTITKHIGTAALAALLLTALPAVAADSQLNDITPALVQAGAHIDGLKAVEVGGIVVLRGRAVDAAAALQAAMLTQGLGYARVANLIIVVQPIDDVAIERFAERKLGMSRGLEGCNFQIDSDNGVVKLNGTVKSELQKDMAVQLVRSIDGVKSVQAMFKK
jgi:osmotically-inducible protein OsmY